MAQLLVGNIVLIQDKQLQRGLKSRRNSTWHHKMLRIYTCHLIRFSRGEKLFGFHQLASRKVQLYCFRVENHKFELHIWDYRFGYN